MAKASQLSRALRPSELSHLFQSIGRKLNGSAHDHVLRAEIHRVASDVLDVLTSRGYTTVNPYYRQPISDEDIDILVTDVTRKRKYHLNYAEYVTNKEKRKEKKEKKKKRIEQQYEIDLERSLEEARWNAYMRNWYGPYNAGWPTPHWNTMGHQRPPPGWRHTPWYFKGVPSATPNRPVWKGNTQKCKRGTKRKSFDVENLHVHY